MKAVIWHDIGDIRIQEPTDVIGVEAEHAHHGSAAERADSDKDADQVDQIAPDYRDTPPFMPGDAPTQALRWAVKALARAGTLSIIGVYPPAAA